jgi:uncharacterized protein (DUF58 family)
MDTEFFRELDKFALLVKKRVSTAYTGGRKSLRFGHGISPVGYREYRTGDDFKLIDWKVYGRTEKLYPGEPRRGRRYLFKTIEELDETVPRGPTDMRLVSEQFDALITSTSLVVMISDFLGDTEEILSSIYRLSRHDLVLIQVLSPIEANLSFGGDIKFVDMETKLPLITRVTQEEKDEYKRRLENHNARIAEACASVGADFFSFRTDKPIFDAFSEMVAKAIVWRT